MSCSICSCGCPSPYHKGNNTNNNNNAMHISLSLIRTVLAAKSSSSYQFNFSFWRCICTMCAIEVCLRTSVFIYASHNFLLGFSSCCAVRSLQLSFIWLRCILRLNRNSKMLQIFIIWHNVCIFLFSFVYIPCYCYCCCFRLLAFFLLT